MLMGNQQVASGFPQHSALSDTEAKGIIEVASRGVELQRSAERIRSVQDSNH